MVSRWNDLEVSGIIVKDVGEFVDMGLLVEIDGDWEGSDVGANVGFFV